MAEPLSAGGRQLYGDRDSRGIYFNRLQAQQAGGEFTQARWMLLLKRRGMSGVLTQAQGMHLERFLRLFTGFRPDILGGTP